MVRIFITGASGYIGGETLHCLKNSSLSQSKIACLNRDPQKGEQILKAYPDVEIVSGDLDDTDLIIKEAEKADVVLHLASTKHVVSSKAIVAGLTSPSRKTTKPGTWIQISGATLFAADEIAQGRFGESSNASYADVSDISTILSTIRKLPSREVEQLAIEQKPSDIQTALVIGPLIYGVGNGPCHTRSVQAPEIARSTLRLGHGFRLLKGENAWSNVNISDLGHLFYLLTKAAADGKNVGWNEQGIYNPEHGAMKFGKLDALVAQEAVKQGLIKSAELKEIDAKAADELGAHMSVLWGTNAVIKTERALKNLGWECEGHSLAEEIPDLVSREAQSVKV